MNKQTVVDQILEGRNRIPSDRGAAFASANIALCKYWGKRDEALNLPVTSSLSISLSDRGTRSEVVPCGQQDQLLINDQTCAPDSSPAERLSRFLDLFRTDSTAHFSVETKSTIPMDAGLASSSSAFASIVMSLDALFGWALDAKSLSILARLGSGSASRSICTGFVEWHVGIREDGMDSFAEALACDWPQLRVGILTVSESAKPIGSRAAMKQTRETSVLYEAWPTQVADDLVTLKAALRARDFSHLGRTAESNALAMHATMLAARPPILYWHPASVEQMHRVWEVRADGLPVYFTMDAGPNLKLLFLDDQVEAVLDLFPGLDIVTPFGASTETHPQPLPGGELP